MHRYLCKPWLICIAAISGHSAIAQSIVFTPQAPRGGETVAVTFTEPFNCAAPQPALTASSIGSFTFESILPSGIVECPYIPSPPPEDSSFTVTLGALSAGAYAVTWNIYLSKPMGTPTLLSTSSASVMVAPGAGAVTVSPGFTGNWYSPGSGGHGFSIEVLRGNVMLAEWFAFGPYGGQAWIVGTGPIVGDTAVLQAYFPAGTGGRFPPNFDPLQLENKFWGTINFTFADCNTGQVSWLPAAAGFTSGSMPIARLTIPAGLNCP